MRSIQVLTGILSGLIAALAPAKDKAFVMLAGELKQITDACKVKAESLAASDPLREVYRVYADCANQHGTAIQVTLSARNVQSLIGLCSADAPRAPAPAPASPPPKPPAS